MFLSKLSIKRPVFATVTIFALLAVGIAGFLGLGMNDMPEMDIPYVAVSVTLPGASPDQVETKVTKEVEEAVGQIAGVKHITSQVSESYSLTAIEFYDTIAVDTAAQDVRTKIDGIRASLPDDVDDPVIMKFDINARAILSLAVSGGNLSRQDLSNLIDNTIVPGLNTVSGVGSITTYGLQEREIQIKLDKEKLTALGLTTDQVVSSLQSDNLDIPSGKVADNSREVNLRTYSSIKNVEEFNNILLATRNGTEIRVGDVAEVVDGFAEQDSLSYYNGQECVGIDIVKQSGSNTVAVADGLNQKIAELQASLPAGVKLDVVSDNSVDIRSSVHNVEETMLEGCVLAVLIVLLFLRSPASTAISAISLPTSIITTFAALSFMDFTLNIITLMALSLAVGLLIDDSIVVIENIVRHLRMGKTPLQAAQDGTSEISLAVMATTFTIVAVFAPMATMSGTLGAFFKEFGLTIAFSVLVSLFVSFTLVPMLASRYVKDDTEQKPKTFLGRFLLWFNQLFDRLAEYYQRVLGAVLNHRKKTLGITLLVFFLSLSLITQMGFSFQPDEDKGNIYISADLDSGLSLESALQKARLIEAIVWKYSDVTNVYTTIEADHLNLNVKLTDKQARKESVSEIGQQMRTEINQISGLDLAVGTSSTASMIGKSYSLHIQGDDFAQLLDYSQKAKQVLSTIPGAVDVGINYKAGKPEQQVVVDRDAAADLGVSAAQVSNTLRTLFNGVVVGQYEAGNDRYDVNVRLKEEQRRDLNSFEGLYLTSSNSGNPMIALDQLTKNVYTTASSSINRYDKSREIQVQANYVGITSGELNSAFMEKLNRELPPPNGIRFSMGGDQASMQESAQSLIQAVILGILFIFLILAAQFESFMDPLSIMFSLPLAIIGALIALYLTGSGLNMVGGIGIVFLFGLVTKNAILLVDFIKQHREEGHDRRTAILEAGLTRLRPILMTTLAMIFGMLPAALSTSTGSELRQPMAIAIIGGLISSTILTLLVVPVIYTVLDDIKGLFKKKEARALSNQEI